LRANVLTHIRCHPRDAAVAASLPIDGVNVMIGTSEWLQRHSHGKAIPEIIDLATEVITFLQMRRPDLEIRFSTEDSFRSRWEDLVTIYTHVDGLGVDRVGVADTVGVATPFTVHALVSRLHERVRADIEFHGHNDAGCAIANSYAALIAGATYIDTCVLGIGERNGITSLSGLIARLYAVNPDLVRRYRLSRLQALDRLVADLIGVTIPFNTCITGPTAFTHKAGIHTKAMLSDPHTYEILDPQEFGVARDISVAHRLTGRHALGWRAQQLGLELSDGQLREATGRVKALADQRPTSLEEVDAVLRRCAAG
jgi:homocitrate synthase